MNIQLVKLAHARSGDKGDTANVGLIALRDEFYPLLVREVTAARVKEHFKGICKGEVFSVRRNDPVGDRIFRSIGRQPAFANRSCGRG